MHNHARIPLAHPLQSYNRLGIRPHLFPPTVTARSQDVTIHQDYSVGGASVKSEITNPETSDPFPPVNNRKPPRVTLINASAYARTCKLEGTQCFQLRISLLEVTGHLTSSAPVYLSALLEEYHNFVDVFSKSKAGKLAEHRPYDLKITLDEGTVPPFSPIYSL